MALLEELVPAGQNISLNVVMVSDEVPTEAVKAEFEARTQTSGNLYLKKRPLAMGSMGLSYALDKLTNHTLPFTISRCTGSRIKEAIEKWNGDRTWDVTVVDGIHAGDWINLDDARFGQIVYRAHNVEADLWAQLYQKENNFIKRSVFKNEFVLCDKFERMLCAKSIVLTVSETDALRMKSLKFTSQAKSLPIGMKIKNSNLTFSSTEKINLLFVGRLDWLPNKEGLIWFLNNVWPKVDRHRLSLTVVGSGESAWLDSYLASDLQIHRSVPDLKSFYTKSDLTLIPLFMGSGTRVKAIESGAYGRSFVATTLGIEGVPVSNKSEYIEANTESEWISALNALTKEKCEELGKTIHQTIKSTFDRREIAKKFLSQIAERKSWEQTSAI
jgi:glycosyltransferase involved in cell wall biosynthesis